MHILIVDDSVAYRLLPVPLIGDAYPKAVIDQYDPVAEGMPGPEFPWAEYDVLILDYQLDEGGDMNGLDWLSEFRNDPEFPVTIFLTGKGDESLAVKALKSGAEDYLSKTSVNEDILKDAIGNAFEAKANRPKPAHSLIDSNDRLESRKGPEFKPSFSVKEIARGKVSVGRYRLNKLIAYGGMAAVYLATDERDDTQLAIKILDTSQLTDQRTLGRFIREYSLMAELHHPNLIKVFEQGYRGPLAYITMEYLPGGDLYDRMEGGADVEAATTYIRDIAAALSVMHDAGIVHRDLKPKNIMFRADGSLALTDLGVSKKLTENVELTYAGEIVGTPIYISPEQILGHEADLRSDLYSLGVMYFELLSGERLFMADSATALMYKHVHDEPRRIEGIPDKINDIVQRMLQKKPQDRYPDAKLLQLQLQTL